MADKDVFHDTVILNLPPEKRLVPFVAPGFDEEGRWRNGTTEVQQG